MTTTSNEIAENVPKKLPTSILNVDKTDYENTPMFFGQPSGLYDSIHKKHPELFDLYKKLKRLDWDENDFSMKQCMLDFDEAPPAIVKALIGTIAFQWETDTVAARSVLAILLPFITSTEVHLYYQRVSDNESLHALAYSEIVRGSFRDPGAVIQQILEIKAAQDRLQLVAEVFEATEKMSIEYRAGRLPYSQDLYNQLFKFMVALYMLESIQFRGSFPITFGIARSGWFLPVGQTVQKICQDELEIHVKGNQYVLNQMMKTPEGKIALENSLEWIAELQESILVAEHKSVDTLLPEGDELVGVPSDLLKGYINTHANDCLHFFGLPANPKFPSNPNALAWMNDWVQINATQGSPQEARQGQYFVGGVVDTLCDEPISMDL